MINYRDVSGRTVIGQDGQKIGTAGTLFVDDDSGRPEWVTVKTGLFGAGESFVPLRDASLRGEELLVPYDTEMVRGAPNVDVDNGHLSADEEAVLYRYYGRDYGQAARPDATESRQGESRQDESRQVRASGGGDDAMTRSEEQLQVGTERVATGRVRLRKYVETENVQQTVPVTKEKVVVEREPITEENRDEALSGPDLSEAEHEVTTYEERPVIRKETVPVERVRLTTEAETGEETVSETVRKERIEQSTDDDPDIR